VCEIPPYAVVTVSACHVDVSVKRKKMSGAVIHEPAVHPNTMKNIKLPALQGDPPGSEGLHCSMVIFRAVIYQTTVHTQTIYYEVRNLGYK